MPSPIFSFKNNSETTHVIIKNTQKNKYYHSRTILDEISFHLNVLKIHTIEHIAIVTTDVRQYTIKNTVVLI